MTRFFQVTDLTVTVIVTWGAPSEGSVCLSQFLNTVQQYKQGLYQSRLRAPDYTLY